MYAYVNTLVFGIYPYIALVVLALGTIVRYDREPYTWRPAPASSCAAGSSSSAPCCSMSGCWPSSSAI